MTLPTAAPFGFSPDQERDDKGRWAPSGGLAAQRLDDWMESVRSANLAARGAIDKVRRTPERLPPAPPDPSLPSVELANLPVDAIYGAVSPYSRDDPALTEIWRAQGFDGPPTVVSPDEFDRARGDSPVLHRGIDSGGRTGQAEAWAEEYRTGEPHAGFGLYGNGTYGTTSPDKAANIATEDGAVVKMALREDARIVDYDDLYPKFREWDSQWEQRVEAAPENDRAALETQRHKERTVLGDPGRHAAALGYQAIRVSGDSPEGDDTYVIQDRTAVIVESAKT